MAPQDSILNETMANNIPLDNQTKKMPSTQKLKIDGEYWWTNGAFVILTHIVSLVTVVLFTPSNTNVYYLPIFFTWLSLAGISAGYHRLWSHRAFKAALPVRVALAMMGAGGFQGSIKWWVLRHRLHHRFTDTAEDPYSIKRGFFHAHMGWIFERPKYTKMRMIDANDLTSDPVVVFQHLYFVPLAVFVGFGVPSFIGYFFLNDTLGGLLYGGFVTRIIVWHCTFCINSVAHWSGEKEYETSITAKGNLVCALLTQGEGYHNFHHAFPSDYRNGIRWYDYDPTKWIVSALSYVGLTYDLKRADQSEIEKASLQVKEEEISNKKKKLNWGPEDKDLPTMTLKEFEKMFEEENKEIIIIDNYVIDMKEVKKTHPGGMKILKGYYGKDATKAFNGDVNFHSSAAHNYSKLYRIAKLLI